MTGEKPWRRSYLGKENCTSRKCSSILHWACTRAHARANRVRGGACGRVVPLNCYAVRKIGDTTGASLSDSWQRDDSPMTPGDAPAWPTALGAAGRTRAEMQGICENIRTAIEHGRTDIIRSLLDACTYSRDTVRSLFSLASNFPCFGPDRRVFPSFFFYCLHRRLSSAAGENGNATEGITRDKILNQPVLEEGTFLSYASKVCNMLHPYAYIQH